MDVIELLKEWQTLLTGLLALIAGSFVFLTTKMQINHSRHQYRSGERLQLAKELHNFLEKFSRLELNRDHYEEYENLLFDDEEHAVLIAYFGDDYSTILEYLEVSLRLLDNQIYHSDRHPRKVFENHKKEALEIHEGLVRYVSDSRSRHPADMVNTKRVRRIMKNTREWNRRAIGDQTNK